MSGMGERARVLGKICMYFIRERMGGGTKLETKGLERVKHEPRELHSTIPTVTLGRDSNPAGVLEVYRRIDHNEK